MHKVLLSLAANCDHKKNLSEARRCLRQVLSSLSFTDELWTDPVGGHRPDKYLNQLAQGETLLGVDELCQWLKDTERAMGRSDKDRSSGIVRIDLDLLQYDDKRYHLRDWERPYVQMLLAGVRLRN